MRDRFVILVIPSGGIPRDALDRHVEVGGEYFDLVDGGYALTRAADGGTELSLTTRFVNKSQLRSPSGHLIAARRPRVGADHPVAAGALGFVQGRVGPLDRVVGVVASLALRHAR